MSDRPPLLDVVDVRVSYPDRRRGARRTHSIPAVQGVSLSLRRGEAMGLVGESGSGKSTLGRAVMGLTPLASGRILLAGEDVDAIRRRDPHHAARRVQMVFQDALGALDPRQRIGAALTEVLGVHGLEGPRGGRARALELLESVGLAAEHIERFPHQLSGGQRQRAGIARALAVEPDILILDEPVSALDVSVQAQILTLLDKLRKDFDLTLLFIAHDLAVVRNVCDRVAVLFRGRIVEEADAGSLFSHPLHPYTRDLLAAIPQIDGGVSGPSAPGPETPLPELSSSPFGCPYLHRCQHPDRDEGCAATCPPLAESNPRHAVACSKVDRR